MAVYWVGQLEVLEIGFALLLQSPVVLTNAVAVFRQGVANPPTSAKPPHEAVALSRPYLHDEVIGPGNGFLKELHKKRKGRWLFSKKR